MERYRSGHNEAVLKTVCPQGRVGSNPTLSVSVNRCGNQTEWFSRHTKINSGSNRRVDWISLLGEVPKWPKGHPWKGCRSLIAARGFKSLLLRSQQSDKYAGKAARKVFKKSAWQSKRHVIRYQLLRLRKQHTEPWQINSNATLKILKKKIQRTSFKASKEEL